MTRTILFYGQPPPFFLQLLHKFGSTDIHTGNETWKDYDWVGVANDVYSPAEVSSLAKEVLYAGKTFGIINTSDEHIDSISSIIGIWPVAECTGVIVTPWYDDAGKQHYKAVFFRRIGTENEASMMQQGKSPDALKYLLLGNAMRMHVQATQESWTPKIITRHLSPHYAIIPIQKRPLTYYANNIHKVDKVQFLHQGEMYIWRTSENDTPIHNIQVYHQLSGFSKDLYHQGKQQSIAFDGDMSYRADNWHQWYDYRATCKIVYADGEVADTQNFEIIYKDGDEVEPKNLCFHSSFAIKTPTGTSLPRWKLLMDFELAIRQQFNTLIITNDALPHETSTHSGYTATRSLSTEWIDAGVLLQ